MDDGVLIVTRTVGADGRSRAHVGGRSVPAGVLAEMGEHVLALHGQSDQQRLLRPAEQRGALDRFAGADVVTLRDEFRAGWARLRRRTTTIAELTAAAAEREREAELLRLGLAEVEAAEPLARRGRRAAGEIARLAHADDLRSAATEAHSALTGEEIDGTDALGLLTRARRALESVADHDPALGDLAARVADASHVLVDVAAELASYAAGTEVDPLAPGRGPRAARRVDDARAAARHRRRRGCAGLGHRGGRAARSSWTAPTTRSARSPRSQWRWRSRSGRTAQALTHARPAAAERFGAAVTTELVELAMPHAVVSAAVTQRESADGLTVGERRLAAGPEGVDDVELLLVAHPGAPVRPLHKGASGGELSRVMLAVEVVFAGSDPVPLMVFDEVDAGVGGKAAVEVGRRLARLARDHQVVVVTHLPQVAAFADRHLLVEKSADGGAVTRSGVITLDDEARVAELSRMLAGLDSGLARGHAEELLGCRGLRKELIRSRRVQRGQFPGPLAESTAMRLSFLRRNRTGDGLPGIVGTAG